MTKLRIHAEDMKSSVQNKETRNQSKLQRAEILREMVGINFISYSVTDKRIIDIVKILSNEMDEHLYQKVEKLKADYHEIKALEEKYKINICEPVNDYQLLTAHSNFETREELEREFSEETSVSIHTFLKDYVNGSNKKYDRPVLTNIPYTKEQIQKYHLLTDEEMRKNDFSRLPETRDAYHFIKNDGKDIYVNHPEIVSLIEYLNKEHPELKRDKLRIKKFQIDYLLPNYDDCDYLKLLALPMGFETEQEMKMAFEQSMHISINEYIDRYVKKESTEQVNKWGLVNGKETYEFVPYANLRDYQNYYTPLFDYAEDMKTKYKKAYQHDEKVPTKMKIEEIDLEVMGLSDSDISNSPVILRTLNEYAVLRSYGFHDEEMIQYIYQKYVAHDALLLEAKNSLELVKIDLEMLDLFYKIERQRKEEARILEINKLEEDITTEEKTKVHKVDYQVTVRN